MVRTMKKWGALLLATALVACGGGGGSSGSTPDGPGGTPETPPIATLVYTLSKPVINNSGSDVSLLTVTALDANNNPVEGVPLTVAVDTGVYTPLVAVTTAAGQASGNITIGADKANRNITANIRLGGQVATAVVAVTGSAISITPVPATPQPGTAARVDIKVTDANGAGVPGVPVALSGSLGITGGVTTDLTGNAVANVGAVPATPGSYTVNASALGVTASRSVQVVGGTSPGIPDVTDTISSASLAVVPNTIAPNAPNSTTNRAALRAKFLNANNQAVQNVRVRFQLAPPALGSGEQLSNTATVYSDVNGEAIADYIAGTRSSPTNGVGIIACYGPNDASIANGACPSQVTATLTVAGQPLSITMGDNNELAKGNGNLTYIKRFDVAVADAAGNAVANAVVSASVDITHYGKGDYRSQTYQVTGGNPPNAATTGISTTAVPSPYFSDTSFGSRVWCPNEDANRNGSLETGEDTNGNGILDSRKADVILSFIGGNVTSSTGRMSIQVEYPQNVGTWLSYTVRVTTNVAGSEGTTAKSYITDIVDSDEANGSFRTPPYGSNRCVDPS